ncbi:MAG: enoyl-CoA hydratase-related protein [Vulcanimicrobiota bacterium]
MKGMQGAPSKYQNLIMCYEDGLAVMVLNRPKALNALNAETIDEISAAFDEVEADPKNRVLLVTGSGDKAFVAGADIRELKQCETEAAGAAASEKGSKLFRRFETSRLITIAGVNGFALGGGMELAMACDFRFAASTAMFGLPEVGLGIIPGYGGTQRLARLVGRGLAMELMVTGRKFDAHYALHIGLVNRVVPQHDLLNLCRQVAQEILAQAPLAVAAAKKALQAGADGDIEAGLKAESVEFGKLCLSKDMHEGMAAFVEKRQAQFKGE